jgi:hypothetical protein
VKDAKKNLCDLLCVLCGKEKISERGEKREEVFGKPSKK